MSSKTYVCNCFSKGCGRRIGGVHWKSKNTPTQHRARDLLINQTWGFREDHTFFDERFEPEGSVELPDNNAARVEAVGEAADADEDVAEEQLAEPSDQVLNELGLEQQQQTCSPALLARLAELVEYGNEHEFSNNDLDWLLKWSLAPEKSVAVAIDSEWRERVRQSPVPDSFAKLISTVQGAGEKIGGPESWRFLVEEDNTWHVFPPLADAAAPCPLCPPDQRPRRKREDCEEHQPRCDSCNVARKDCKEFVWLGHAPHLRASMVTEVGCRSLLGAWSQKERWRGKGREEAPEVQHEVWDGEVFREHSAFLDPEREFTLPLACERCNEEREFYCSRHLKLPSFVLVEESKWNEAEQVYEVVCERCGGDMRASREELYIKGDPRNVPVMPHFDGFQASSTTGRLAAILDFQPLTVCKEERLHLREHWVCPLAFPPVEDLGSGVDFLDPVMWILTLEYIRLFIKGLRVEYALPSKEVDPRLPHSPAGGTVLIRVMLLALVADFPGLAELLKFAQGGYNASRRCKKRGVYEEALRRVVYAEARSNARFPCQPRTIEEILEAATRHRFADSQAERDRLTTELGWSGFSFLLLLVKVSRFNPPRMTLSDHMHRGALNLVKNWINDTLMLAGGEYANRGKDIDERDPLLGPVVELEDFGERLSRIWPTRELKSGRFPVEPGLKKLGYWKAEEFEKFARVCGEVVYAGCIDAEGFVITSLVCKIEQLVHLAHRLGWSQERKLLFEALCLAVFVRMEEYLGTKQRPLAHDLGRHSVEDIKTHGSLTAFWVWAQERYVRRLVRTPTNGRQMAKTYAKREHRGLTSRCLNRRHREAELKEKGLNGADAVWALARKEFEGLVFVLGQESALEITQKIPCDPPSVAKLEDPAILHSVETEGVAIGSLPKNWRISSYELLGPVKLPIVDAIVRQCGGSSLAQGRKGPARVLIKSLTRGRANYSASDFVIVAGGGGAESERFGKIEAVYVVRDEDGQHWPLMDCTFFEIPLDENGRRIGAPWHNKVQLGSLQQLRPDGVCTARDVLRHFIPYPEEGHTPASSPSNIVIEIAPPSLGFSASDVKVPLHIEVGDVVRVASDSASFDPADAPQDDNTWESEVPVPSQCILKTVGPGQVVDYAWVVDVDTEDKRADLVYLRKVSGGVDEPQCWKLWRDYANFEMGWDDILDRVGGVREEGRGANRRFYFQAMPPILRI
ncbi:hypothetical protein KFL_010240020 [Klebsormidium nitens]|uniref:Uncharacterized protein n=1 Tax=Klebsormidium nitens TaxID=105231 RepID=A0A1Y1ISH3_KLENI|nr:hypothetical protein KFL_010240020 [Klebsormidium nitens]|eukprot:GAQ92479.1 hypothetical protein KFL_010240020 [Klebsormidium nitens]